MATHQLRFFPYTNYQQAVHFKVETNNLNACRLGETRAKTNSDVLVRKESNLTILQISIQIWDWFSEEFETRIQRPFILFFSGQIISFTIDYHYANQIFNIYHLLIQNDKNSREYHSVYPGPFDVVGSKCSFCSQTLLNGQELTTLPCTHHFHRSCSEQANTQDFCYICRHSFHRTGLLDNWTSLYQKGPIRLLPEAQRTDSPVLETPPVRRTFLTDSVGHETPLTLSEADENDFTQILACVKNP